MLKPEISNEYADLFSSYDEIPKSVFAAIVVSLILKENNETIETVEDLFFDEWEALNVSGIVSQEPLRVQR